MHDAATVTRDARAAATSWTAEMVAAVSDPALTLAAKLAWLYLWDCVGRGEADVTALLDNVSGPTGIAESTLRGTKRRADGAFTILAARGYLIWSRRPNGEAWVAITAQPASCTRVAPDPQLELPFARDPDGAEPAPEPPPTVALHAAGPTQAAASAPEGPGARNPREIRADSARPQRQEIRARTRQNQEQEPKKLGLGSCASGGRAESARISRGGGPAQVAGDLEALGQASGQGPDLAGHWTSRQKIVDWITAMVPGACPIQAGIAADAVMDAGGEPDDLYRALHYARTLAKAHALKTDFASAFFGSFQSMARRRGFQWPRKPRPK